jgi:glycosyltransferase involved in cell wall biosynthesis
VRIAIILTYPLYHGSSELTVEQWLEQPDRERRMAALMAQRGHQVEYWAVGKSGQSGNVAKKTELPGEGYKICIFSPQQESQRTRFHFSEALVTHARHFNAHLHILKGIDGGAGIFLLRNYLLPNRRPFVFIIGGGYYSKYVPRAEIVFYETQRQKNLLQCQSRKPWRKKIPAGRLVRLPKYIDTDLFRPRENQPKQWDILVVGRLIARYKSYRALAMLSRHFRTAVIGDGPEASRLHRLYPEVTWLGHIPNHQLPHYYNRSFLFMHTGFRDFYPRVLAEALACGVPCVAFTPAIAPDVLPTQCGLLVPPRRFIPPLRELLLDKNRLRLMAQQARLHALEHMGDDACGKAIKEMFCGLEKSPFFRYPEQD